MERAATQSQPKSLGILKGKFSHSWNDLPNSARNALRESGVVWLKCEFEFLGTQLVIQPDGRITDSYGLIPLINDGIANHCKVMAGNATKDDVRQILLKVYEVLVGDEK